MIDRLKDNVTAHGLERDSGHRPHITICYNAPESLDTHQITPIDWLITQYQLAERTGTGNAWSYRILKRWELGPEPPSNSANQLPLFS